MKILRLVFYLSLGFLARSVYLYFLGSGGLADYRALEVYRDQLQANLKELQEIHEDLLEEQRALASDPEQVALQARELGYFRAEERVLRLDGYSPLRRYFTVGKLIRPAPEARRQDWIPKMLALVLPSFLYLFSLVRERRNHAFAR
jgi:cell division protein FtsB